MTKQFEWSIPSEMENDLRQMLGVKIVNMIKTSHETFQAHLAYLKEVQLEGYSDKLSFFKYSYGAIMIFFSNETEYSFASAEDLNSIIMRCERNTENQRNSESRVDDANVLDRTSVLQMEQIVDFKDLLNQRITEINILTTNNLSYKEQCVPSDKGLEFVFENDKKLVLSHNLTENSFVFGVLTGMDNISPHTIVKSKIS